jgi:RecB family endonuclease NucS
MSGKQTLPPSRPQPLTALVSPSVEESLYLVKEAISKHRGILIVGNCIVDYKGRASSKLEPGQRIVIFKEDGSVLVHRPVGYEPVNWQPPGCLFHGSILGDSLQINAVRRQPAESVKISFDNVYLLASLSLSDTGEFSLHASEEDMQRAILLMPSLVEEGLKPISYEKKIEPGFVDVYGEDKTGRFVVIEIKRKTAGKEAALQLAKYVDSVKGIVNKEVRGVLVAPSLGKGVQRLLTTLKLEFRALDPRKCAEVLTRPESKRLQDFFK